MIDYFVLDPVVARQGFYFVDIINQAITDMMLQILTYLRRFLRRRLQILTYSV